MAKKQIPNAWDDDWETLADRAEAKASVEAAEDEAATMTRAERLAKHEEENRRLWKSADAPEDLRFLPATSSSVPMGASGFKPTMKVLSRKPAPQMIRRRDPVTGLEQLTLRDDAAEAEAEAAAEAARNQLTPEQIRQRQQREREAKQRKYDEARAKIFGEPLPKTGGNASSTTPSSLSSSSRQASPIQPQGGFGTPPQSYHHHSHNSSGSGSGGRGRGRGRGGYRGDRQYDGYGRRQPQSQQQQQQQTSTTSTPAGTPAGTPTRELYDPSYTARSSLPPSRSGTPRDDDFVIRTPKGPDGSGRGGFGFARRGT